MQINQFPAQSAENQFGIASHVAPDWAAFSRLAFIVAF